MTAVSSGPVPAFLFRAGIVAGVLAIIAGILGMHVMTGNHSMHHSAAAQLPAAVMSAGDSHSGHQGADRHEVPHPTTGEPEGERVAVALEEGPAASCTCSAECAGVQAMSAACTPSAKTGTLAAPEPGQGTMTSDSRYGLPGGASTSYAYLPGSPSPGELSISRT
jgi:hypothetical protein